MNDIARRLEAVRQRIRAAEQHHGRAPGSVALLAVSKGKPPAAVAEARNAGQTAFGENYLQDAEEKLQALAGRGVEWHFIGPLQSNKTKAVAARFDWVHSVDREKIARRLSEQRPDGMPPLNVCLQVNVSGEASKAGLAPAETASLARAVAGMPRLRLRGLMCLPAPSDDFETQRRGFRQLRELLESMQAGGLALDTLSMGMSADLEAAIAEGATLVRVGTDIFGPRD